MTSDLSQPKVDIQLRSAAVRRVVLLCAVFYSGLTSAEVMDKEFSLMVVLVCGLGGATALFTAARWLPWALVAALPLTAGFFYLQISEILDPAVADAIRNESGYLYVAVSWGLLVACIAAMGLGLYLRRTAASA